MAKKKPVRQQTPKKSIDKKIGFLAAFRLCGNVTQAAEIADVCRPHVYTWIDTDPKFAQEFEEARKEAVDRMVQECQRRAFNGVKRLKFTGRGQLIMVPHPDGLTEKKKVRIKVGKKWVEEIQEVAVMVPYVEHEYSDTLAIFLLKAHDPERFRENVAIQAMMKSLNANLNLSGDGTQLKTAQELLAENQVIAAEINRLLGHDTIPVGSNGHTTNGTTKGD